MGGQLSFTSAPNVKVGLETLIALSSTVKIMVLLKLKI
jgi:hypothetical protein